MKHQYDFDVATCINFLRTYGLEKHVKMNIETNDATLAGHEMQHELEYAGLQGFLGSIDAKVRRESFEPVDLFHAHIGGMDAFAHGLKIAAAMRADGRLQKLVDERYASWSGPLGRRIEGGSESFASLEKEMLAKGEAAANSSGRQEMFENLINCYL